MFWLRNKQIIFLVHLTKGVVQSLYNARLGVNRNRPWTALQANHALNGQFLQRNYRKMTMYLQRNYRKMTITWSFSYNSFVKKKIVSHNMTMFYPNLCYTEMCYKGIALWIFTKCCVYYVLAHIYIFNGVQIVNWFVSYLYIHVLNRCCMGKCGKRSKILNTFLFLSSNEILVIRA